MGFKIKSTSGWDKDGDGSNEFGFNALPAGIRKEDVEFEIMGQVSYFWTSTDWSSDTAADKSIIYDQDEIDSFDLCKTSVYSI